MTIKVRNPESDQFSVLDVKPVDNIPEPGWSVTLENNECVLINLKDGGWEAHPGDVISREFAQAIGSEINPFAVPVIKNKSVSYKPFKSRRPRL